MSSKRNIVITCWNCHEKFTISASSANPPMKLYRGLPSTKQGESRNKKMRLLKTCPYCGKENEIYL